MRARILLISMACAGAVAAWPGDEARAQEKTALYDADDAPTFVDLNAGESFRFRLKSGRECAVRLEGVRLVERSTYDYGVEADVVVDGHPLKVARWFASDRAFTPPTAVNGMRIALEIARAVDGRFRDKDNANEKVAYWTKLEKDARLLVNDMTMPLWPGVRPLWDDEDLLLTADEIGYRTHTFYGRRDHDTGAAPLAMGRLHNDLDIAFDVGTPHYAALKGRIGLSMGASYGLDSTPIGRKGNIYQVRTGHISKAFKDTDDACEAGEKIALSGDKLAGSIPHTHLALIEVPKSAQGGPSMTWYRDCRHLNPWWLVWQGFENERERRKWALARMGPLSPAKTGAPVAFTSRGSEAAAVRWDFGDGAGSDGRDPKHAYDGAGIYEVRLTAFEKGARHSVSQFITVEGPGRRAETPAAKPGIERVIEAVADAQVYDHKDSAKTNFGAEPTMALHAGRGHFDPWPNWGGNKSALLRFDAPKVKNVTGATLELWVSGDAPNAIHVLPLAGAAWDEKTVTFATALNLYRPQPIGTVESRPEGWRKLDVSDYVLERLRAGAASIDFALRAAACDTKDIVIDAREGKHPPRLVIQYVP